VSTNPAELLAMITGMTDAIRQVSAAMNQAVAVMVADGWTEEQARAVVASLVARGGSSNDEQGETA